MKIQIKKWLTVILMCLFLYTPCVWCAVDLGDLSYHVSDDDFGVQRTYNSRRVREGLFGFGWCSVLETELKFGAEGKPKIITCDGAIESKETLPRIGSEWIWNSGPGRFPIYKFGFDGRLTFIGSKLNRGFQITWNERSIELDQKDSDDFQKIIFYFTRNSDLTETVSSIVAVRSISMGRLSQLDLLSKNPKRQFSYENGLLTFITDPHGASQFTYNSERNMSALTAPGRIRRQILYDKTNDEIKEVKREDGCFEFYERPKQSEAARARLICRGHQLVKEVRG